MSEPIMPPPVRPPTKPVNRIGSPAGPAAVPEPPHQRGSDVQWTDDTTEPLLADLLANKSANKSANNGTGPQNHDEEGPRSAYAGFMGLNRPVDPDKDLAQSGTRLPKYVVAAMNLMRSYTGRTHQEILAKAATGEDPIPPQFLDEAFRALYGYQRPRR
jgi:hypothetical protein